MKKINLILLIVLSCCWQLSAQQLKRLRISKDQENLWTQIKDQFAASPQKAEADSVLTAFEDALSKGVFSAKEKQKLFEISNRMEKQRAKLYPDYKNYLQLLLLFKSNETAKRNLKDWELIYNDLLDTLTLRRLNGFLEFSIRVFTSNVIHEAKPLTWTFSPQNNFVFKYDEKEKYRMKVIFNQVNLVCKGAQGDTLKIYQANGIYYPLSTEFQGSAGKVTFERAGIPPQIYINLRKYKIDLTKYQYTADSVELFHPMYFGGAMLGKMSDRALAPRMKKDKNGVVGVDFERVQYPQFESFDKKVVIKNIIKDIDFQGSFAMQGQKFLGKSTKTEPATLLFYRGGKLFLKASSDYFTLAAEKFTGVNASVTIYLGNNDSIFHSGVTVRYIEKLGEVRMDLEQKGNVKRLYRDTYHKVNFDAPLVVWRKDSSYISIGNLPGTSGAKVTFESADFFSGSEKEEFESTLMGIKAIVGSRKATGDNSNTFTAEEIAQQTSRPTQVVQRNLIEISAKGLIEFSPYSKKGRVTSKLQDYLDVRAGKKDFDNFAFTSILETGNLTKTTVKKDSIEEEIITKTDIIQNAVLNLTNLDLTIRGVSDIPLQNEFDIVACPYDQTLLMQKNRNFKFNGYVTSGKYYCVDADAITDLKQEKGFTKLMEAELKTNKEIYGQQFGTQNGFIQAIYSIQMDKADIDAFMPTFLKHTTRGNARFDGHDFYFVYDDYQVKLNKLDSIQLGTTQVFGYKKNNNVYVKRMPIRSTIEKKGTFFTGTFQIDKANNKSGRESTFAYPVFTLNDPAYVFYDKRSEQVYDPKDSLIKGIYPRDKFYYQIEPFVLDSLNALKRTLSIPGKLVSAGIFPDIKENLRIMPDNSFGFFRDLKATGLPMYNNKATFASLIVLSNRGFESTNGELRYITSTSKGKDFRIYPDSTITRRKADNFVVAKQTASPEYPSVKGDSIHVRFYPNDNKLIARNDLKFVTKKPTPFIMYDNDTKMKGTLTLSPKILNGKGAMDFKKSTLTSDLFGYKSNDFKTDSSIFVLRGSDNIAAFKTERYIAPKPTSELLETVTTYSSDDKGGKKRRKKVIEVVDTVVAKRDSVLSLFDHVQAHVDFANNEVNFKTVDLKVFLRFIKSTYTAHTDKFKWYLDKNLIEIGSAKETTNEEVAKLNLEDKSMEDVIKLGYAKFVCPKQDSLNFFAGKAMYRLDSLLITTSLVPSIAVADALIHPSEPFIIEKTAYIRPLKNAKITANRVTQYHHLYNATVNIYGRKEYAGNADIVYTDITKQTRVIHFKDISVDSSMRTIARGVIDPKENFLLSPYFAFKGKVNLYAQRPWLEFDGQSKLTHECKFLPVSWFKFNTYIKPDSIYIPVDMNPEKRADRRFGGLYLTNDSAHVYSNFISPLKHYNDNQVFSALDTTFSSVVYFDLKKKSYIITKTEKVQDKNFTANTMTLDVNSCNISCEGEFGFGIKTDAVGLRTVGNIVHKTDANDISFDVMVGMNFHFSPEALEVMGRLLMASSDSAVDLSRPQYGQNLTRMVGSKKYADTLMSQLTMMGRWKEIPAKMKHTILFNDLRMKWDSKSNSYKSEGKIGIGSIGEKQINKFMGGFIQILHRKSGDVINIQLKADDATWFFFTYSRGTMQAMASINKFNDIIFDAKEKDRKLKSKDKEYIYEKSSLPIYQKAVKTFEGESAKDE